MPRDGRRRIDVNHTSQLESFIYLSSSISVSVSGFRFPDSCCHLVLHLLWKPASTLHVLNSIFFSSKFCRKDVASTMPAFENTTWNINKPGFLNLCYSLSFRIDLKLHLHKLIVNVMISAWFKTGVERILFPLFSAFTRKYWKATSWLFTWSYGAC